MHDADTLKQQLAARFRQLQAEHGLSAVQLEQRTTYDRKYIGWIRNGGRLPARHVLVALDEVFGTGQELADLGDEIRAAQNDERLRHKAGGPRQQPVTDPEGVDPTNRRDVLALGLVTAAGPEVLQHVLRTAAGEAMEFTRLTGVSGVGAGTFDHLEVVVTGLDRSYSAGSPAEQFATARVYRIRVQELIRGPHTLKEARQLYVYAAQLDEMLAWLAHDLGSTLAAEAYAIDAFEHAEQAGHHELCAWATDAMASIAMYNNQPDRALNAAMKGMLKAPASHPLAVRLRAQAARAHARLGQRQKCEDLLADARDAYDLLPSRPVVRNGVDTAVLADYALTAYPASSYIWLGDFEEARRHAEQAVAAHEAAPPASRSPSREAIARLDLGIAAARLGSPDEAIHQGRIALASPRVVESVRTRAADLDSVIAARYPHRADAHEFRDEYRSLIGR